MIKPDISYVTNIHEFYEEIKRQQSGAHGVEYLAHHNALIEKAKECETIKEIGVCQGATLAAMMLTNPKKLIGFDIMPKYFNPYKKHFDDYAKENDIDFEFIVGDSINPKITHEVDMLHIDSLHKPEHLMKELIIHAPKVKKYIAFHDTANYKNTSGLLVALARYITEIDQSWRIVDHYIHRVGYTVIERVNNRLQYMDKS